MKIKTITAVIILGLVLTANSHALGIGLQGNYSTGGFWAPGLALLISPSDRAHAAINWYLEGKNQTNIIGVTFDLVPLNLRILPLGQGSFNFTLGVGVYSNFHIKTNSTAVTGGARVPIGFNLLLGRDAFEIFTHVAPSFGVDFTPDLRFTPKPFYPIALGARLWLR